jgi:hypothetical protein
MGRGGEGAAAVLALLRYAARSVGGVFVCHDSIIHRQSVGVKGSKH